MTMKRNRGFTLIEALVSVLILTVVMVVALTLLVSMRSFASKQQAFTAPRQTARAAVDYVSFFLAGATDLNVEMANPNALVMWTTFGNDVTAPATVRQASYNNLTAAQAAAGFGDEGTDIISFSIATNPIRIPIVATTWTGNTTGGNTAILNFSAGCAPQRPGPATSPSSSRLTGAPLPPDPEVSGLLTVQDEAGRWRYLRITRYVSSDCTAMTGAEPDREVITIEFTPGTADQINPPGGWRGDFLGDLTLNAGIEYTAFRVRNGNLEQKTSGFDAANVYSPGIFNPNCDVGAPAGGCPSIGFTPVVENVEDLQVAYVFRDGTVWNTADPGTRHERARPAPRSNIPDAGPRPTPCAPPGDLDVTNVRALRVSVIARSNPLDIGARQLSESRPPATPVPGSVRREGIYRRPALEDHAMGPLDTVANGVFDRYRLTTTLVLRNRMLGF